MFEATLFHTFENIGTHSLIESRWRGEARGGTVKQLTDSLTHSLTHGTHELTNYRVHLVCDKNTWTLWL